MMDSQRMNPSPFPADNSRIQPLPAASALFDINSISAATGYRTNGGDSGSRAEINPNYFNRGWSTNTVGQTNPSYFSNSNYDINSLEYEFSRFNLPAPSHSPVLNAQSPVYNSAFSLPGSRGSNIWGNHSGNVNLTRLDFPIEEPQFSIAGLQRLRAMEQLGLYPQTRLNPSGYENSFNLNRNNGNNSHNRSSSTTRFDSTNSANTMLGRYNIRQPRFRQNFLFSTLQDMRAEIHSMAKDQHGCRFLQDKLKQRNPDEIEIIFWELKDHTRELMKDQSGNYLMQELFRVCSQEQISELLLLAVSDERIFKEICTDMHGTRAVQTLLEHLTTTEQRSLMISFLKRITVALTKSVNGHHIIQHCLKNFSVQENKYILDEVADNCIEIATDRSGCCILQQCLGQAHEEARERLIEEIQSNALLLSEHPYGNYVAQYAVGLEIPRVTKVLVSQLSGHFVSLSMNKYGSNVVEKFLRVFDHEPEQIVLIIEEIIYSPSFLRVLQDPYGNYVAQTALEFSKGPIRHALINGILMNYAFLHTHPHGKRVLARTKGSKQRI